MKQLPKTNCPLVVRADFTSRQAWKTICRLIREPVPAPVPGEVFYAYVEFLDDEEFGGLDADGLVARLGDYDRSFLFMVDNAAVTDPEFPILVVELRGGRRRFRAIPSTIQAIENNLSISNMDFFEFADAADQDGIFRGFRTPG